MPSLSWIYAWWAEIMYRKNLQAKVVPLPKLVGCQHSLSLEQTHKQQYLVCTTSAGSEVHIITQHDLLFALAFPFTTRIEDIPPAVSRQNCSVKSYSRTPVSTPSRIKVWGFAILTRGQDKIYSFKKFMPIYSLTAFKTSQFETWDFIQLDCFVEVHAL